MTVSDMEMKITGGGHAQVWGHEDERPHKPGPEDIWQESVVLVWWDLKQKIGGFYRIGHEPNRPDGPHTVVWSVTYSPEGIFRKCSYLPTQDFDRMPDGQGAADAGLKFRFTDHAIWTLEHDGISADLHIHDYHPGIDGYPKHGDFADIAPKHMEVCGAIKGSLTVKGKRYEVDGVAVRDHGWGIRAWDTCVSHRWFVGTVGPELSWIGLALHSNMDDRGRPDELVSFGWVVRHNEITYAKSVDIVAHLETDALTIRGGVLTMELTTGETLVIEAEAQGPGAVMFHHDITCVETLCKMTVNGMVGAGDFEISNNASRGVRRPKVLKHGIMADGWQAEAKVDQVKDHHAALISAS